MDKSKVMMIVIILLLVLLLGAIVGISLFVMKEINKEPEAIDVTPPPQITITLLDTETFSAGKITRNLRNDGSRPAVVVATYSFEVNTKDDTGGLLELLNNKVDAVRDIINSILGDTSYDELTAVNGEALMKEKILNRVSETFQTNRIIQVNTSELIYQYQN